MLFINVDTLKTSQNTKKALEFFNLKLKYEPLVKQHKKYKKKFAGIKMKVYKKKEICLCTCNNMYLVQVGLAL